MDLSPQAIRAADFRQVRKGFDPEEVTAFLALVADELERAQNQATAMEARARAAVQRLQELTEQSSKTPTPEPAPAPEPAPVVHTAADEEPETEKISRVLILAQKTADETVAEAKSEATRVLADAQSEADRTIDSTRQMSAQMIDEARVEARKAQAAEREALEGHVNSLQMRRGLLETDVNQLEQFLDDQRSRLRNAATGILDIVERVPNGLAEVRAPVVSGAAGPPAASTAPPTPTPPAAAPPAAPVDPTPGASHATPTSAAVPGPAATSPGDDDAPVSVMVGDNDEAQWADDNDWSAEATPQR